MSRNTTKPHDMPPEMWGRAMRNGHAPATISAAELLDMELPPVKWAVPGVLPEGVTILGGKPKIGKSWVGLGLGIAVATGGYALGKIRVEKGSALCLALEDNRRRLQRRLKKMLSGKAPAELEFCTEWPRAALVGVEALKAWLAKHPDARLVVVDTLKKFRPQSAGNRSLYDVDYEALEPLLPGAAEYGVAILVVHHLRKLEAADPLDMLSGSTGLSGGVDGALVLKRVRGEADATLAVDGRDIEEPSELALRWDGELGAWSLMGDAAEYRLSEERRKVIELLERVGEPLGPKDVAEASGLNYGSLRVILPEMVRDGTIASPVRGKYTTINNVNNVNSANNRSAGADVNHLNLAVNNPHREKPIDTPNSRVVNIVNGVNDDYDQLVEDRTADLDRDFLTSGKVSEYTPNPEHPVSLPEDALNACIHEVPGGCHLCRKTGDV